LGAGTVLQPKTNLYLYIPDATGLSADSPVRVDGIDVGAVREVRLSGSSDPNRVVRVTLEVARDRLKNIPEDSVVQLSAETLIGDKFVDIASGKSANHIEPGAEFIFKFQPEILKTLDLSEFNQRLQVIDSMISDLEQGRSAVGKFVLGEEFYKDLIKRTVQLERAIHVATSTTAAMGSMLYTDQLYRDFAEPLARFDQALAQIQSGQGEAGQLLRDSARYENLRNTVQDLQRSIANFQKSDFVQSDGLYTEATRTLAVLIERVDEFNANPLLERTEMYDSLNGAVKEMADTAREFRQDPRKFLRLKMF
jgi:phospholipid/cholesterol/gamma-HCH transport system substrate-binding protein